MYDIRVIRSLYPNPIPARCLRMSERGYCVGGAVMCYLEGMEVPRGGAFPSPHTLAAVLRQANPRLNRFEARTLASQITSANDTGDFAKAWARAEEALNRHRELRFPKEPLFGVIRDRSTEEGQAASSRSRADAPA